MIVGSAASVFAHDTLRLSSIMEFGSTVSLISAGTALVASVVGPVIALTVSRRQYNATVVSTSRQKWIEALRDSLSELIALIRGAAIVKSRWKDKWDSGLGPASADPALLQKFEHIVLLQSKIDLLINPTDGDHQFLHQAIATAIARLQAMESGDSDTGRDIAAITRAGQTILRREWQRVKIGT
jgi:hypothetical protein